MQNPCKVQIRCQNQKEAGKGQKLLLTVAPRGGVGGGGGGDGRTAGVIGALCVCMWTNDWGSLTTGQVDLQTRGRGLLAPIRFCELRQA